MQSKAATVKEYLEELTPERREQVEAVRKVILENLPEGYEEVMNWGMITYQVPLEVYPDTYNKKPMMYAALASQKNHMAVYLTGIYMDSRPLTRPPASVMMWASLVCASGSWMTCRCR
jgi:hypothetical protein